MAFLFFFFLTYIYVYSCVKVIQRYLPHFSEELKIISHHLRRHTWTNCFCSVTWNSVFPSGPQYAIYHLLLFRSYFLLYVSIFNQSIPGTVTRSDGFLWNTLWPCDAVTLTSCSNLPSGCVLCLAALLCGSSGLSYTGEGRGAVHLLWQEETFPAWCPK